MSSVPVVAIIKAKKNQERHLFDLLKKIVSPTHQEKGCMKYGLHRSIEAPDTFVMIEKWETIESLQNHLKAPHITSAFARQAELIENISIYPLKSIPVGLASKEII